MGLCGKIDLRDSKKEYYLLPEVARGAHFHGGGDVFLAMKYFSECTYLCLRMCTIISALIVYAYGGRGN